jgi:hypothetical protein
MNIAKIRIKSRSDFGLDIGMKFVFHWWYRQDLLYVKCASTYSDRFFTFYNIVIGKMIVFYVHLTKFMQDQWLNSSITIILDIFINISFTFLYINLAVHLIKIIAHIN